MRTCGDILLPALPLSVVGEKRPYTEEDPIPDLLLLLLLRLVPLWCAEAGWNVSSQVEHLESVRQRNQRISRAIAQRQKSGMAL